MSATTASSPARPRTWRAANRWLAAMGALLVASSTLLVGCATLDEKQREWIFQPGQRTWAGGLAAAEGMADVWIPLRTTGAAAVDTAVADRSSTADAAASPGTTPDPDAPRLHGLWLPQARPGAPVMLYLHGARYDVRGSAPRLRRWHELGFSVLAVDYRGFGRSSAALPSEASAHEDALTAWRWLAARHPDAPRYAIGHSLGGAIAVGLAAEVDDMAGLIVEASFTSIPDVVRQFRYGWLPLGPLITQRFDAASRIGRVKAPVLVLHGSEDRLIPAELGRALYERAPAPKRFVLVDGGSHHNASRMAGEPLRAALGELFGLRGEASGS